MPSDLLPSLGDEELTAAPASPRLDLFGRLVPSLPVAMLLVALLALLSGLAKGFLWGVPVPVAQDEFGYLLTADTLASGRLANPTHPMWRHIESMFVIQHPAYNSKYQPAQSAVLALGQRLSGEPIAGVWLSTALAAAALCWMFWQWLSPPWAFLGSLLAVTHLVINYWNYTYWGGSVAAIGSALLFGALRRLPDSVRVRDGLLLGAALALFILTRPFEGMVACAFAALGLVLLLITKRLRLNLPGLLRLAAPAALMLLATALFTGYYNWRNTGKPLEFPQAVHYRTYYPVPYLITGHPGPEPALAPAHIKAEYEYDLGQFQKQRTLAGFFAALDTKLKTLWSFYFGIGLLLPLLALPGLRKEPWILFAASTALLTVAVILLETWVFPHYAAPVAALLFLLPAAALPAVSKWRTQGWALGRIAVSLVVVFHVALLAAAIFHRPTYIATQQPWAAARQRIIAQLTQAGGSHLVLVHYTPSHDFHSEWVYNRANLDTASIVWAHDLSPSENREILDYFPSRSVWLLDADAKPPRLSLARAPR